MQSLNFMIAQHALSVAGTISPFWTLIRPYEMDLERFSVQNICIAHFACVPGKGFLGKGSSPYTRTDCTHAGSCDKGFEGLAVV